MKNYYDILQVSPRASTEVIDSAWKALIRQCHPDKAKGEREAIEFGERTRALNQAHDILSNSEARTSYDAALHFENARNHVHINPDAYPLAYPAVPRIRFDPRDILQEFVSGADLPHAIENAFGQACQAVMAKVVRENPIIGEILEYGRNQKRKKSA